MSQWEEVKISEVYDGLYDGPHATPTPSEVGPIFLGIGNLSEEGILNLTDNKFISEEEFPRWTKRVLPQYGDIVFTYEASLHRYAIIPENFRGCLGRRLALIRPNNKKGYYKFLFYYFLSAVWREEVNNYLISGATVDRIPLSKFPNFKIKLPPLPIQKKIAAILSAYDDLIENNNRRIALLEKAAEELYKEWFVRMRFPGHESAKFEKGIPEGWENNVFKNFCELKRGYDLPDDSIVAGNIPVIASTSIKSFHNCCKVKAPVITTGRSGSLGTVLYTNKDSWPLNTTLYVKDFCGNSSYFIYYTLKCLHLENFNAGAGVPSLNRNHLAGLGINIPNRKLQEHFHATVGAYFVQVDKLNSINANLKTTRDRLLTRLISGKLSVEELDIKFPKGMKVKEYE